MLHRAAILLLWTFLAAVHDATAQSVLARVSGSVYDEQRGAISGAVVAIKNVETGQARETTSGSDGSYHFVGVSPGRYVLGVERPGFAPVTQAIDITVGDELERDVALPLAVLTEHVDVGARASPIEASQTELRQTITAKQVDELPVPDRDFTNLALLAPGILVNQVATGSSTGIETAGQTGRSNNYFVDGLTLVDTRTANARGGVSLDAVKEFAVLSNNFEAEYGVASGAVLSVVTRSGTNTLSGRVGYYHRDSRWDATSHAARLIFPPLEKSPFEQKDISGFVGGPIAPDRAFFFGSLEDTLVNDESIITSGVLQLFRPGAPTHLPSHHQTPQVFGRGDLSLNPSHTLTVRYRMQRDIATNLFVATDVGLAAPERAFETDIRSQDFAVWHRSVVGVFTLNELRFQFATRTFDRISRGCPGPQTGAGTTPCWEEDRPGVLLGKFSQIPNGATDHTWQVGDSLTYVIPRAAGEHTLKTGMDVSVVGLDSRGVVNGDGTYRFTGAGGAALFDPANRDTYPTQYSQTLAASDIFRRHTVVGTFLQDRWKPRTNITVNMGLRWDYDHAPGVAQETGDIAPRLGVAFDPKKDGKTSIRAGLGLYYARVPFIVATQEEQGGDQILITNPGYNPAYPDPFGPNPRRRGSAAALPPSTTQLVNMHVPYTEQLSIGAQRALSSQMSVTADFIVARGRDLMATYDLNYPDLTSVRPDPSFQRVTAVESVGSSWYRGLQIGLEKRYARGHSYTVAYTLSTAERNTEDYTFVPLDQRNLALDHGPAASDVRHRLSVGVSLDLAKGVRFTTIVTGQSALPYTITTGKLNIDGYNNDRPPGVGRNSARGADFRQVDARLSKAFHARGHRVEALVEAFNVVNRANWTNYDGNQASLTFGRPTAALPAREVQLGARVTF
jgi:hypothetical protein